jgi:ABC-type multidrug transport system ATPase subunit
MTHLIELNAVTRTFGAFTALHDITLSLPPGRVGLLGPNGAGKSTLLKILMGLIPPSGGTGRVLDEELGGDGDTEGNWRLRRLIGFMPEADALVPGLTGVEYVSLAGELYGMPRREAQRRAHEVLSYLELEEARYRRVEEYSTGMKQRAKLAQALVHDPPVLLLDEPTSGLDPALRREFYAIVARRAAEGATVLLASHALTELESSADRVVIVNRGAKIADGALDDLRALACLPVQVRIRPADGHVRPLPGRDWRRLADGRLETEVNHAEKIPLLASLLSDPAAVADLTVAEPTLDDLYAHFLQREAA